MQLNQKQDFGVGIDIGMNDCRLSLYKDKTFTMVPNSLGQYATPSYVAFTETGIEVG